MTKRFAKRKRKSVGCEMEPDRRDAVPKTDAQVHRHQAFPSMAATMRCHSSSSASLATGWPACRYQ
jgi:hypothetical protein